MPKGTKLNLNILQVNIFLLAIGEQAELAHSAEGTCRKVKVDEAAELVNENAFGLDVGTLNLAGLVMRMGNIVTNQRGFACKCTLAGHLEAPIKMMS